MGQGTFYSDGDQAHSVMTRSSLLHRVVVLTAIPDLFSVVLKGVLLLTGWLKILAFESVLGTFKSYKQLPAGKGGRVIWW